MRNVRVLIFGTPDDLEFQGYADLMNGIEGTARHYLGDCEIAIDFVQHWEKGEAKPKLHESLLHIKALILLNGKFTTDERQSFEAGVGSWLVVAAMQHCLQVQDVSVKTYRSSGKCLTQEVTYSGYT